jgi:hypothetical protein
MNKALSLLAALLLFSAPCWSAESAVAMDRPSMSTTQTVIVTAQVEAINHETREVTLLGPEGKSVSFVASEDARNLKQVEVGDIVVAEYVQTMSIEVFANDGYEPNAGNLVVAGRSEEGEMPALTAIDATVVTATLEEINLENNTFKLKGPTGVIQEYEAMDPENLTKVLLGDLVVITYTEAVALSVEKTTAE